MRRTLGVAAALLTVSAGVFTVFAGLAFHLGWGEPAGNFRVVGPLALAALGCSSLGLLARLAYRPSRSSWRWCSSTMRFTSSSDTSRSSTTMTSTWGPAGGTARSRSSPS